MKIQLTAAVATLAIVVWSSVASAQTDKAPAPGLQLAPAATAKPEPEISANPDEVVARIGTREVKRRELDGAVRWVRSQLTRSGKQVTPEQAAQLESGVLEELVNREVLLAEARKNPPPDLDAKVETQIKEIKDQLGGEEGLVRSLEQSGITVGEYLRRVRENVLIDSLLQKVIDREVKIAPEEVRGFYDDNKERFKKRDMVRASHILIRVPPNAPEDQKAGKKAQIEALRSLLVAGENFAELAKKNSEDPGSAARGGDLGLFPRGAMVPEIDAAAFSLKTNELSEIITTQYGYHILLVTERQLPEQQSFEEAKAGIEQFFKSRKGGEVVRKYIAELRKAAKVEILLAPPGKP
jgi:peptidyl-prolyl cis-trans isomerase C